MNYQQSTGTRPSFGQADWLEPQRLQVHQERFAAWPEACRRAGVPGRLLHDCRRTAARNLVRAGVPERVAMQLTGHRSRAIFDRYCIVREDELHEAAAQLVAYVAAPADAAPSARMEPPGGLIGPDAVGEGEATPMRVGG